jgi:hypothetical protein
MSTVYWPHLADPRAGKRYAGHFAEMLEERGTLARVAVYGVQAAQLLFNATILGAVVVTCAIGGPKLPPYLG